MSVATVLGCLLTPAFYVFVDWVATRGKPIAVKPKPDAEGGAPTHASEAAGPKPAHA
jgi:hypothetical protein